MPLINPSIPNLKNIADKFPRGDLYDLAQALVVERDQLNKRLNALFGGFLEIKQGQPPVIKARVKAQQGSTFPAGGIDGRIIANQLITAGQSFVTNFADGGLVFSATDHNTVAWTAGVLRLADNRQFSISSGNTGNMAAFTYIYFDEAVSNTVLQTTTDSDLAVGDGKILMCVANNIADTGQKAFYLPSVGVFGLNSANIQANSISAGSIQAGAVTAAKINVSQLSAISADMGTIMAGSITSALYRSSTGTKRVEINYSTANEMVFYEGGTGVVRIGSSIGEGASPGIEVRAGVFYTIALSGSIGVVIDENQVITPSVFIRPGGGGVGAILAHATASTSKTHTFPNATGTVINTGNLSSITAVGTISSGTWQGTAIADGYISSASTWNTASSERRQWDGGSTNLVAATGRTSLGLGTMATQAASDYGTSGDTGSSFWVAGSSGGSPVLNLKQVTIKIAGVSYNVLQADIV